MNPTNQLTFKFLTFCTLLIFLGSCTTDDSNKAPVANAQSGLTVVQGQSLTITLTATDADGDDLSYQISTQPNNGTATLTGNMVAYTASADFTGEVVFAFTANDGSNDSNVANVTINVTVPAVSYKTIAVDAGDGSADVRINFATGSTVSSTTASWHIGYRRYIGYKTNSGSSGSGNVETCVAKQYTELYNTEKQPVVAEFQRLTAALTVDDFNGITASSYTCTFQVDSIRPFIILEDWLNVAVVQGNPIYSASTGASNGWIVKTDEGNYARVKVQDFTLTFVPAPTRYIKFQSELYNTQTMSFGEAQTTAAIEFTERQYYDIESNAASTQTSGSWDLSIGVIGQDYPIYINNSPFGTGEASVGAPLVSAAAVTNPLSTSDVYRYFQDSSEGALHTPGDFGPFEYDVNGKRLLWPTFAIYVVKDGDDLYKFQVISNNGTDGTLDSGNLVIRYQKL